MTCIYYCDVKPQISFHMFYKIFNNALQQHFPNKLSNRQKQKTKTQFVGHLCHCCPSVLSAFTTVLSTQTNYCRPTPQPGHASRLPLISRRVPAKNHLPSPNQTHLLMQQHCGFTQTQTHTHRQPIFRIPSPLIKITSPVGEESSYFRNKYSLS